LARSAGLTPDWLVGDMDSVRDYPADFPAERVRRQPRAKDYTDTELAIELAYGEGAGEVWLAGGGGGRLDHTLALCKLFTLGHPPVRWLTAREDIRLLSAISSIKHSVCGGGCFSLFPLPPGPWRVRSEGLRWPLDDLDWAGGAYSLSNEALEGELYLRAEAGSFLFMRSVR
jgi:thiamine pyrophosphokinase